MDSYVKELDKTLADVSVTRDCECCNSFRQFFILPYFPISNSNIAQIGPIGFQTCLCHNKVFEVNVSDLFFFEFFTMVAPKMTS